MPPKASLRVLLAIVFRRRACLPGSSIAPMHILVIEDEAAIANFLEHGLSAEGYSVSCVGDGESGRRHALDEEVDLVILDRMLPGLEGLQVLDAIRRVKPALPVIVLTARGEIEERVEGLDRGATDYLTKPFAFDELTARVRAHLRQPEQPEATKLEVGDVRLDLLSREVERDGTPIHLSAKEFDLLAYLMRHPGQVLSREQILAAVWGYRHDPETNVVQVYVGYLRRRLAGSGSPAPIETVRSVGYRLTGRESGT
jgi:two-component system, OmpR family, response regulator